MLGDMTVRLFRHSPVLRQVKSKITPKSKRPHLYKKVGQNVHKCKRPQFIRVKIGVAGQLSLKPTGPTSIGGFIVTYFRCYK